MKNFLRDAKFWNINPVKTVFRAPKQFGNKQRPFYFSFLSQRTMLINQCTTFGRISSLKKAADLSCEGFHDNAGQHCYLILGDYVLAMFDARNFIYLPGKVMEEGEGIIRVNFCNRER